MGLGNTTSAGKNYLLPYPQSWLHVSVRVGLSHSPAPIFPGPVYEFVVRTLKFICFHTQDRLGCAAVTSNPKISVV